MTLQEIMAQVAEDNNLPRKLVERTYMSYWRAIREHITSIPLKEDMTDEEFTNLQPNVNIPSIGKLFVTLDRYRRMRRMYKIKTGNKE